MQVIAEQAEAPYRIKPKGKPSVSIGMILLLLYAWVGVGRPQEIVPALTVLRLGLVTGGLALLVWLHAPGRFADKVPLDRPIVRDVMILLGLAVATVPIGVWPGHSFLFLFNVFLKTILLFFLVIYWCRTVPDVRRFLWFYCVASVSVVLPGVISGHAGQERYSVDALSYDANDIAFLQVLALPLIVYLYSTSGRRARIWLAVMALLCLYGVVLTQSRGGFLALVFVGGLILWRSSMDRSAKWGIIAVAVIVFGVLAGTAWKERIRTMWSPQTEYDETGNGRTDIWKTSLKLLVRYPWGVGIDGFVTAEGLSHGGFGKWSASHNSFLQVGVELGVAGLIVFLHMLVYTIRLLRQVKMSTQPRPPPKSIRRIPAQRPKKNVHELDEQGHLFQLADAVEITMWGFMVGGFFLSQAYSSMLFIMLALGLVFARLAKISDAASSLTWQRAPRTALEPKLRSPL